MYKKSQPYTVPPAQLGCNTWRVSAVWLDHFHHLHTAILGSKCANYFLNPCKYFNTVSSYYFCRAAAYNESSCGDLTERRRLRESMKCHSFDWFLTNVYPELQLPGDGDKSFG